MGTNRLWYCRLGAVLIPAGAGSGLRLGTKRLFLLATCLFLTGSVLAGSAWDANSLIAFHVRPGDRGRPDHAPGYEDPLPQVPLGRSVGSLWDSGNFSGMPLVPPLRLHLGAI